jgi:hypothetical protein
LALGQTVVVGNLPVNMGSNNKLLNDFHFLVLQASRLVGLDLQVTGALGKRTKFQSQDFAQLTLDVEKSSGDANVVKIDESRLILPLDESQMPTDIKLDDEVRLHRIKFQEEQRQQVSDLSFTEQVFYVGPNQFIRNALNVYSM